MGTIFKFRAVLFRDTLQSSLHQCMDTSLRHLASIWHDIGLSEEQQCNRTKVVLEHVQSLFDDMRSEEEECRTQLKDNVRTLQAEYSKLCSQLAVSEIQASLAGLVCCLSIGNKVPPIFFNTPGS